MKKLLTPEQLTAWKNHVHLEYVKADIAYQRAAWRERLFKRYLYRYIESRDNEINEE